MEHFGDVTFNLMDTGFHLLFLLWGLGFVYVSNIREK